ncbi:MAG TPA: hypothetical protein VEW93_04275 [Acidimicrobiales bacterium]|nr:hypothetical protein [Acidimicrobiales bacterium]
MTGVAPPGERPTVDPGDGPSVGAAPGRAARDLASTPLARPRGALRADVRRGWRWLVAGWRGTALGVAVVAVAVALPLPTLFHYQGPPMEEGFMLVFPERVLAGDLPNRDFLHLYGPGSLWALAAWFKVAGTTLAAERVYGLAQHLGIIFGLFALALPWGRRVATVCGLLGVLLVITPIGLTALAWNGAVALAVIGSALALRGARHLDEARPGARWWLGAGGVVLGAALLFRPDLVVGVALALAALGWRRWSRALVAPVAAGLALGVAPVLVHLATAGVGPSFEGMFLQPVFELRGGRTLPIPPAWDRADGALQAVAQLRTPPWPFPMFGPWPQVTLWFWALPLAAVALLATGVVAVRREGGSHRSRILVVVGALGVGLLPQALQRPDTTHLAWVSCVSLVFLPVAVVQWGEWWSERRRRRAGTVAGRARLHPGVVRTATALLPLLLVIAVIPAYTARTWVDLTRQNLEGEYFGWAVRNGDRTFYLGSPDIAASAQAVVDELRPRLRPGERLLVGTADLRKTPYSDAYFYFLFPQATPGTRYIEMDPGIANAPDSGLAREVATSDWLILSHAWDAWSEPNDSREVGSDAPNQVVRDHFCPVGDQGPSYQLWRRCR